VLAVSIADAIFLTIRANEVAAASHNPKSKYPGDDFAIAIIFGRNSRGVAPAAPQGQLFAEYASSPHPRFVSRRGHKEPNFGMNSASSRRSK